MDTVALSVITPAWNEARNVPALYERLRPILEASGLPWEWIVVDDHSRDDTFAVVERLAAVDHRVRGVRLARNSGSHTAIACGLEEARGAAAVVLAADLQDPPEVIPELLARWRDGARVVWASRRRVPGEPRDAAFSRLYYAIMRCVVGMRDMPAAGADFFLIDRAVIDAMRDLHERHTSIFALITWIGFRQEHVEYDKQARLHGASGWTLRKKLKLVADSITGFSDLPVRVCWVTAAALVLGGLAMIAGGAFGLALGVLAPAHVVLLGAMMALSGIGLTLLAALGEYVWRALDEARRRPRFIVEARTPGPAGAPVLR
jgi:glycosyltransferase involved in cell wall biosynthesis